MTRRLVGLLCLAMVLASVPFIAPAQVRRPDPRLDRLERRVESLRVRVVGLENALGLQGRSRASGPPDGLFVGGRLNLSDDDRDRIRRLQRRLVHLEDRISFLEDMALSPSATSQGQESAALADPRTLAQRRFETDPLGRLSQWLGRLEQRAIKVGNQVGPGSAQPASPSPTPSPSASGSASPTVSPSPTTAPSSEPSPAAPACAGVQVSPSTNLQAVVDANPPRTTFCFAAGTYRLSNTIWTADRYPTFDLRAGAVIDGQSGGFIGINGPDAPPGQPGTTILGGVFQHFGNAGAPAWVQPMIVRRNGLVDGSEFRDNFSIGLTVQGDNAVVSHAFIHHNGRYGLTASMPCVSCGGPAGVIISDSEIAFNNTRRLPTDVNAGGTKFLATDGMIVRGNEVHDNYGAGLWWDGSNRNLQVYQNLIHNNWNWGILYETGQGGTRIFDNTLTNNAVGDGSPSWFNNVQLLVSCADGSSGEGIRIYGNRIDGAAYPLGLINHAWHTTRTRAVYVHHNDMTLRASTTRVGAMAFNGLTELFDASADVRFDYNSYQVLDLVGTYWAWGGRSLSWGQWQAVGQDVNGTLRLVG